MIRIDVTDDELRYLIACGVALLQNLAKEPLSNYCRFSREQIIDLIIKLREIADANDIKM